ncbi:hypothetical protein ElyMa_005701600 [Elysia marginata]|uniref:Uncharacterized protein n=1 Tax=Elysia marginata TaxID=1093978 RepID=A0AAV4FH77_9GAST|nr:hypothetical protein ElyMa_005701600 [Elysia marginata]
MNMKQTAQVNGIQSLLIGPKRTTEGLTMPFQGIPLTVPFLSLVPYPHTPALLNQYIRYIRTHTALGGVWIAFVIGFMQQTTNGRLAPILINDQPTFKEAQEGALDTLLANTPDITGDTSGLVYRIGFLGLLSLFKEVNELNTKYTAKRRDAFKAAAKFKLGPWDASFLSEPTRGLSAYL